MCPLVSVTSNYGSRGIIIFGLIRYFILLSSNPFLRVYYTFSIILFVTLAIDVFIIFNKGACLNQALNSNGALSLTFEQHHRHQNFTHFHENVFDDKWVGELRNMRSVIEQ